MTSGPVYQMRAAGGASAAIKIAPFPLLVSNLQRRFRDRIQSSYRSELEPLETNTNPRGPFIPLPSPLIFRSNLFISFLGAAHRPPEPAPQNSPEKKRFLLLRPRHGRRGQKARFSLWLELNRNSRLESHCIVLADSTQAFPDVV
ncbi:hypothetical protein ASPZODRAFT_984179 [Penicilliopsis zonata CBS 506.65]|uniref:Uncharacterized protein n=1 Tax=Penicilliopsis zonata CBS 506.65 TaxID=1073090 RepID=A0A1L9SR83_9EURO|nr:hypothetical protein ASPZODRAFT_984179 [Penicilliopsis zonata CBS 506.65]OJJ49616.1 hypothetical protein ASPZODRAFT_984179 [Penicilliopsis zonata CBS 506.65]